MASTYRSSGHVDGSIADTESQAWEMTSSWESYRYALHQKWTGWRSWRARRQEETRTPPSFVLSSPKHSYSYSSDLFFLAASPRGLHRIDIALWISSQYILRGFGLNFVYLPVPDTPRPSWDHSATSRYVTYSANTRPIATVPSKILLLTCFLH